MKPFHYFFTRVVNKNHWTIALDCNDGVHVTSRIERGPCPHWHTSANGTSLDEGAGQISYEFKCTRVQALRYAG